jgi:hypothetical protein
MSIYLPSGRRVIATLGWLTAGMVLGGLIGTLFWCGYLVLSGQSISKALGGDVEDAWGVLQGLLALGVLIGGGVGLLNGLRKVTA